MPKVECPIRPRVISGVQPSGKVHIGNFVGALSVWAEDQDVNANVLCVVDLHALTIPEAVKPDVLRARTREVAALYMACGIDPEKSIIFVQSEVPAHAELAWILNCTTPLGWLNRMTQFKSKADKLEAVGAGLFDYPVLQAADILLYETNVVPVGDDQKQHIELCRDIAQRFNNLFGDVFVLPEPKIRTTGARIMAFDDPTEKMSKSTGEIKKGHSVGLLDAPDDVRRTIMRATTDAGTEVRFERAGPGVLNLLRLYHVLTGASQDTIEATFEGKGYGALKKAVADVVISVLEPIQQRHAELIADESFLDAVLRDGTRRARAIAEPVLNRVKRATGLGYANPPTGSGEP